MGNPNEAPLYSPERHLLGFYPVAELEAYTGKPNCLVLRRKDGSIARVFLLDEGQKKPIPPGLSPMIDRGGTIFAWKLPQDLEKYAGEDDVMIVRSRRGEIKRLYFLAPGTTRKEEQDERPRRLPTGTRFSFREALGTTGMRCWALKRIHSLTANLGIIISCIRQAATHVPPRPLRQPEE